MSRVPRRQATACIDHFHWPRGLRAAPVRPEEVQIPFYFRVVTTHIENPQGLLNLHLPQNGARPGRPRMSLPEVVYAGRVPAGLQVGLNGTYGPGTTRYNRQRGLGRNDILFETFNCLLGGSVQAIHVPPFCRSLQHVARSDAVLCQFHKRIVVCHLILTVLPKDEWKKGSRTVTLTLTRPKMTMTDSNSTFTGMISSVSLAAVRVAMSAFNAAVAAG